MQRASIVLCIIAFVSAGLLGFLRWESEKANAALDAQLAAETSRAVKLGLDLAATRKLRAALQAQATLLESDRTALGAKLAASETRAARLELELTRANTNLSVHEANTRALSGEIAALRRDLADTRAAQVSPEAVAAYKSTIAELEQQLALAARGGVAVGIPGAATAVFTRRGVVATVLSVGPENAFVVLNFGAERGAQTGQRLAITQGTESVATVLISDVRPGFSIGQVLPDSLRAVLQKGDPALLLP